MIDGRPERIKFKLPEEYKIVKNELSEKIDFKYPPPLPGDLELAMRKAVKYGDRAKLDVYRASVIQQIVLGTLQTDLRYLAYGQRLLEVLGLTPDKVEEIRVQTGNLLRRVNTSEIDIAKAAENMYKLLQQLNPFSDQSQSHVKAASLGCGYCPEASAVLRYLGHRLQSFVGIDDDPFKVRMAAELSLRDPRLDFECYDLSNGLPDSPFDFVMIRNPNVYIHEFSRQSQINPVWERVFRDLKPHYPNAKFLITTLTQAEATQIASWLSIPAEQIGINQYATPFQGNFGKYGTYHLPTAVDKYYISTA